MRKVQEGEAAVQQHALLKSLRDSSTPCSSPSLEWARLVRKVQEGEAAVQQHALLKP